jgi:ABC-type uncharacterized transport system permease subunit
LKIGLKQVEVEIRYKIMTQAQTFQPTFMQKFLGRNYKWWYILKYNLVAASGGLGANFYQMLGTSFESLVVFYVWFSNGNSSEIITYLLIGRIYKSIPENYFYNSFGQDVIDGKIVNQIITPQPFIKFLYVKMIGRRVLRNILESLSYILAGIIFVAVTKVEIIFSWRFLILILFIPITFSINHFFGVLIGAVGFFLKDSREFAGFAGSYLTLRSILSGMILPLDKAPFSGFFQLIPYAWVLHHQVQIYLGKYTPFENFYVLLGGIFWCIILYFLANFVFKMGLKRNESVGL